jgi:ribonuclease P protein component
MLPNPNRLNLKKDFKWIRSGLKLENDLIRLFYKFGDNTTLRLGIATPSKDFKLAVERNRARRLVSTVVQDLKDNLPANLNLLVFPKSEILEKDSVLVTSSMKGLLNEIPAS